MLIKRASEQRGTANAGWLNSKHTFSFGHYYDPSQMGFGTLRVINEDRVMPGAGFGTHPHNNMEIVSYVLSGALEHRDSMGNGSIIKPGDVQRMSAGTGVTHSEYNHSKDNEVHFLQIWFLPEQQNITPGYEQKSFSDADKQGQLKLVLSRDGHDNSVRINQDINMYAGRFHDAEEAHFATSPGRLQWIQVARGNITVNNQPLQQGDGLAVEDESSLHFSNAHEAEVILFDMKA